jgi:hypothetical protein
MWTRMGGGGTRLGRRTCYPSILSVYSSSQAHERWGEKGSTAELACRGEADNFEGETVSNHRCRSCARLQQTDQGLGEMRGAVFRKLPLEARIKGDWCVAVIVLHVEFELVEHG